jgi:CHAD domain-containing protein
MSTLHPIEFIVPACFTPGELVQSLRLRPIDRHSVSLVYYDSFDWRLYRHGFEYAVETTGGRLAAVCGDKNGGRCESAPVAAPPRFAGDLPEGEWRGRLAEALDVRALLPRLELRGERCEFVLEDEAGAVMLNLVLESFAVARAGISAPLPARVRLAAAGRFRREFRCMAERLHREFGLEPAKETLLSAALAVLGELPEDPSALPRVRFDPEQRADAAVKEVFRNLLEVLRINEAGVKAETDTEFLHDFRVAVRRTRSLLGQIKKVFPDRTTQRFLRGFAELGRITGEARDLDVYLLDFDRHGANLPESMRGHLEPLRELLQRRAAESHARLNRYLDSAAYGGLIRRWGAFLDAPPPRRPRAVNAGVPVRELAGRRIWKLYRQVMKKGGAITPDSPPEQVHELRKTAKKLRYLMEFFRSLYPADKIGPLMKILKGLQDHLGEYQDVHVQIARVREFSGELRQTEAPTETLLALGALLGRLYARERALRETIEGVFREFAEDAHQRKFRHLFKPAGSREESDKPECER